MDAIKARLQEVRPDAPPKPAYGQPCNGCGLCCSVEVCKIGQAALGEDTQAPCELMLFENGRFWCKLVLAENMAGMEPIIAQALGAGRGCDSSDEL
jgi:hypothetical protein